MELSKLLTTTDITAEEYFALRQSDHSYTIIDIREPHEIQISKLDEALQIPMQSLLSLLSHHKISNDELIILLCRTGSRSNFMTQVLIDAGYKNTKNFVGGINDWVTKYDHSQITY